MDDDEVFVDKDDDEEMDDELRDFIVDDNAELSQYESEALAIDAVGEDDEASARDEARYVISLKRECQSLGSRDLLIKPKLCERHCR